MLEAPMTYKVNRNLLGVKLRCSIFYTVASLSRQNFLTRQTLYSSYKTSFLLQLFEEFTYMMAASCRICSQELIIELDPEE